MNSNYQLGNLGSSGQQIQGFGGNGTKPTVMIGGGSGQNSYNGGGGVNTTNIGYSFPNAGAGAAGASNPGGWAGYNQQYGLNGFGGGARPPQGNGFNPQGGGTDINSIIQQQLGLFNQADQKNQANWDSAKAGLLGTGSGYQNDPNVKGSSALTQRLLANPEALNDQTVQRMKNQADNSSAAQTANQLRTTMGMMAAGGQMSPSAIMAAQERAGRTGLAQQQTNDTNIDIQRANQRNQDIQNAAHLGQQQAAQDNGFQYNIQNSIMSHIPQNNANNLMGLAGIALASNAQNQGQQNANLAASGFNGSGVNLQNPVARNPIGGAYNFNRQNQQVSNPIGFSQGAYNFQDNENDQQDNK